MTGIESFVGLAGKVLGLPSISSWAGNSDKVRIYCDLTWMTRWAGLTKAAD
jgi:hypothetical protein